MPATRKKRSFSRRGIDALCHLLFLSCVLIVILLLRAGALFFIPFRRQKWVPGTVQILFRRVLGGFWSVGCFLRLIQISMEGKPILSEPVVFVANHPSFVDALLLIPHLPQTACVYRASLERSFLPRTIADEAGFISNSGGIEVIRAGVDRLQQGWSVLLFPEGTRTSKPPMGAWNSSFALMATRAQTPIQPIFIAMNPPLFPKGMSWRKPPEYPIRVRIRFGLSISPPGQHTTRNFHREVETSFRHELNEHQTVSNVTGR